MVLIPVQDSREGSLGELGESQAGGSAVETQVVGASAIPLSDTPCTVAPQCAATVSRLTCRPRIRHTIVRHATPHCMASRWRTNLNRGIGRLFFVVVEAAHLFAAGELVVDCEHKRVVGA